MSPLTDAGVPLPLAGRLILVVEDEPIIAMDVARILQAAGASVFQARTLSDALCKVECPTLSAAVLDHALNDGDASKICDRLNQRNVPFVIYSGYNHVEGPCSEGPTLAAVGIDCEVEAAAAAVAVPARLTDVLDGSRRPPMDALGVSGQPLVHPSLLK